MAKIGDAKCPVKVCEGLARGLTPDPRPPMAFMRVNLINNLRFLEFPSPANIHYATYGYTKALCFNHCNFRSISQPSSPWFVNLKLS